MKAMRDAAERFAAAKAAGDASGQRTAIADSLNAMMDAVRAATREAGILAPLVELLAALEDANTCRTHPLLEAAAKNGAPRLAAMDLQLYGALSACITVLMKEGRQKKPEAIRHVKFRLRAHGMDNLPELSGMRDKVMTGDKGDAARDAYRFFLGYLSSVQTMAAVEKVDRALDILVATHGQPKTS